MWWLCLHDALPTKDCLGRMFTIQDPICPLCGSDVETITHLFFYCPWASHLWIVSSGMLKLLLGKVSILLSGAMSGGILRMLYEQRTYCFLMLAA